MKDRMKDHEKDEHTLILEQIAERLNREHGLDGIKRNIETIRRETKSVNDKLDKGIRELEEMLRKK